MNNIFPVPEKTFRCRIKLTCTNYDLGHQGIMRRHLLVVSEKEIIMLKTAFITTQGLSII